MFHPANLRIMALRLIHLQLSGMPGDHDQHCIVQDLLRHNHMDEEFLATRLVKDRFRRDIFSELTALACELIDINHQEIRVKQVDALNTLGRDLDSDLLIAAYLADRQSLPRWRDVTLHLAWPSVLSSADFSIQSVQKNLLNDGHVHLGASLPGSFFWVAVLSDYLSAANFVRDDHFNQSWNQCIDEVRAWRINALSELAVHFYKRTPVLHTNTDHYFYESDFHIPFVDPVLLFLKPNYDAVRYLNPVLGERWFLWASLAYLRNQPHQTRFKEKLYKYLKVRNSFIRELMYGQEYRGLMRFRRTFRLNRTIARDLQGRAGKSDRRRRRTTRHFLNFERFRIYHALRYQFSDPTDAPWARDHGAGLFPHRQEDAESEFYDRSHSPWRPPRQVELRVSPTAPRLQLKVLLAHLEGFGDFVRQERDAPPLRLGFTFHVLKRTPHDVGQLVRRQQEVAWARTGLISLLNWVPSLRPFVIGLDAASAEMNQPPRDLSPFLRKGVRPKMLYPDVKPERIAGAAPLQLRRTFHAGEDYPDPLSGLRWMDDALMLLELRPGERIGHGLALAQPPVDRIKGAVYKPALVHVIDLVWVCAFAEASYVDGLEKDRDLVEQARHFLADALHQLNKNIVAKVMDKVRTVAMEYYRLDKYSHEAKLLHALGLDWEQLGDWRFFEADADYVTFVTAVQARLRQRFCRREVVLEICPTSNLLIGNFGGYEDLPYLNVNRSGLKDDDLEWPVLLSMNTDNPGNFRTTIANEYRLMGRALRKRGYKPREIALWLEEVRRVSEASSFIPDWSPPTKAELESALARIRRGQ